MTSWLSFFAMFDQLLMNQLRLYRCDTFRLVVLTSVVSFVSKYTFFYLVFSSCLTGGTLPERRRVFWGAFAIDSHASISTGWPCLIDPDDVSVPPMVI